MFLGFFFLKITKLSASNNFDSDCIWGFTLSLTSVKISSFSFLAIMSKGVFLVSVASNPSSTYFLDTSVSNLLSGCRCWLKILTSLKTLSPNKSYNFIALLTVISEFSLSYFIIILLVTPIFFDNAFKE